MAQQDRAAHTRHRIIQSAAASFDLHGFRSAGLARISRDAGVSAGALHFHFATKEMLAEAVGKAGEEALDAAFGHLDQPPRPALQQLVDGTHRLGSLLRDDVVVRASLRLCDEGALPPELAGLRTLGHEFVRRGLARADAEGDLALGLGPEDAAVTVIASLAGLEVLGRQSPVWLSDHTLRALWRLLLPRLASGWALPRLSPEPPAASATPVDH